MEIEPTVTGNDREARSSMVFRPNISLQWHITTECSKRCRHCYMYDGATFSEEKRGTLSPSDRRRVLDSVAHFEHETGIHLEHVAVTGGDPLLAEDWRGFLRELQARGIQTSLMGNPETLTEDNVAFLAEVGVASFQMSLDGNEPTHDYMRGTGSFARTVEKIGLLRRHDIRAGLMFTLFPENASELVPLMRFVAQATEATVFSFDVGCYVGNAAAQPAPPFGPEQLRAVFSEYLEEKARLKAAGYPITIGEKANLLKVVRFEKGELAPVVSPALAVASGCYIGWTSVSILSDGAVLACRRMPVKAGKLPEQSFADVFLGSPVLRKFRRPQFHQGCGTCDFYQMCRGCPAYVYSVSQGDPLAAHPACFRHLVAKPTREARKLVDGPPLTLTNQQEAELVARRLSTTSQERLEAYADEPAFRRVFLGLAYDLEQRRRFFEDPFGALRTSGRELDDDRVSLLMHFFQNLAPGERLPHGHPLDTWARRFLDRIFRPGSPDERSELDALRARAAADVVFEAELLQDPRAVVGRALGFVLPADVSLTIDRHGSAGLRFWLSRTVLAEA